MAYEPQFDFSDYQSTNPTRPLPGHQLDVELWNISDDVTGLRTDLKKIQRSDGELNNGIVKFETLAADVAPRLAVLQGGNAVSFASRADFVLALSAPWVEGALATVDNLFFRRDSTKNVIPAAPGWVPHGAVTPNHFAENSTPGATDMTAAINAALSYADTVFLRAEEYLVSGTVTMHGRGKKLIGQGSSVSLLVTETDGHDIIAQTSAESQVYGQAIGGMTIRYGSGAANFGTRTGGAHVYSNTYPRNCTYSDLELQNVFDGFNFNGAQFSTFDNIRFNQFGMATGGTSKGRAMFRFANDLSGSDPGYCTDVHISNVNGSGYKGASQNSGIQFVVYANRLDGLYITNSHFIYSDYQIYLDGAPNNGGYVGRMASLMVSNTYFDTCANSHVVFTGALNSDYRSMMFGNCQFRNALGATGAIYLNAAVAMVSLEGCIVRDAVYSGILSGPGAATGLASNLNVSGCVFSGNNTANSSAHGDVIWRGNGGAVSGNSHIGGGANGYTVLFASDSSNTDLSGCNTSSSTAKAPNIFSGTNNWFDGCQIGSNANGTWNRFKDGRLECMHSLLTSSAGDTTWTYGYPFKSGTVPTPAIIAANLAGPTPSVTNLSGAPAAASMAFNVFNTSGARQAVTARVAAFGVWK